MDETYDLRILDIIEEAADTRSFILDISGDRSRALTYKPGQFVSIHALIGGIDIIRQYSISGNTLAGDPFRITVKRVPGGSVSNWLFDNVTTGETLKVGRPSGRFHLDANNKPIVLIGAGVGITPLYAIASDALFRTERSVHLLLSSRDHAQVIFGSELRALQLAYGSRVSISHHFSGIAGRITEEDIQRILCEVGRGDLYLCGPPSFTALIESWVYQREVLDFRVFIEHFSPAKQQPELGHEDNIDQTSVVTININASGTKLRTTCKSSVTILEAALAAGIDIQNNCRQGRCGICIAKIVNGEVVMDSNVALSRREKQRGMILTCQTRPKSTSIEIDLDV